MKVVLGIVVVCFVLLLLLDKNLIKKGFELLSVYWFRLAFSFLALFVLNVVAGFFGVYVPVNVVSGLIITVLGLPGVVAVCALAIFL